jgi:hypothetical protein
MRTPDSRIIDRMMTKTQISPQGCWEWQGTNNGKYGVVGYKARRWYTHRLSYALYNGELVDGLQIDHLCKNVKCWNPSHLEQVDCKTNLMRGNTRTAQKAAQTECVNGHQLAGDNVRIRPNGTRACRSCGRLRSRRNYWKNNPEQKRVRPAIESDANAIKGHR